MKSGIEILKQLYFRKTHTQLGKLNGYFISNKIKAKLSELIIQENGLIDGDKLKKQIFPTDFINPYNVFISHSHNDIEEAKYLAKFFCEAGFKAFLDSYVWGSADNLIKAINDKYCKNNKGGYKYKDVLFVTSHVHSILSMAIMETISQIDIFLFIESSESINLNKDNTTTLSPWLYQEINFAQILPVLENKVICKSFSRLQESVQISHRIKLENFINLTARDLIGPLQSE